ncbi:ParB/RepB/Spo0J family partition protein [Patescibacteria group bacterium]|nr:ParB/RepB/Spo0J family partition protein [Patescibacteria group bacterium]
MGRDKMAEIRTGGCGGNRLYFPMAFQGDSIYWVEVEKIVPNPFQPRREFDEQKLKELSESIRMYGILQPLTVTRKEVQREDGTFFSEYELIAGERRLRASKLAGLSQVPVIIRDGEQTEQEKLELAIIENLQREDLNAVDRALAFQQLANVFGLSHQQVAVKVGRSREYVSNTIRLLALPAMILEALQLGKLSEGHARTLLMLSNHPAEQEVVFKEILLKKLSVREVERIARTIATDKVRKKGFEEDADIIDMEKRFMDSLGTRVKIQRTDFGGRLTIDYFSTADLEAMLVRIRTQEEAASAAASAAHLSSAVPLSVAAAPSPDAPIITEDATPEPVPHDVAQAESLGELYEQESAVAMETAPDIEAELVPEPEVAPLPPVEEPDESDLYAINRFTI